MHKADAQQWLVTGANGNLGRRNKPPTQIAVCAGN